MNCQEIQKFSFTYLDGEFASHERGEFEEHLRRCTDCRQMVDREAMMREVVARHLRPAPCGLRAAHTNALRGKVCSSLDRIERQHRNRAISAMAASVAVVAIAVVVVHGVAGDSGGTSSLAAHRSGGPQVLAATAPLAGGASAPFAGVAATRMQPAAAVIAGHSAPVPQPIAHAMPRLPVVAVAALAHPDRPHMPPLPGLGPTEHARGSSDPLVQQVAARVDLGAGFGADHPDRLPDEQLGEVLSGRLPAGALVKRSPFGAVRSADSLRQMVQVHMANVQPEVTGSPLRIQRYLESRVQGVGALPLAQGAGVQLAGARIHVLGGQPVVIYQYLAFGAALTVVSRPRGDLGNADVEPQQPEVRGPSGVLLDRHSGVHLLHAVAHDRVLTLVGELAPAAMVQLLPSPAIL